MLQMADSWRKQHDRAPGAQDGFAMNHKILALIAAGLALMISNAARAAPGDMVDFETRQPIGPRVGANPKASAIPRETVAYSGPHAPGTILISTAERRLYFILPGGQAVKYGVGVGRPGFEWGGTKTVSRMREWPDWTPPPQMLRRRPDLPRHMPGGPNNPLGARAMYLGSSLYRIHGSNEPESIGQAVSSGCIRMTNDDVQDLYSRVKIGTRVTVMR
jgi:lipoprotein-anchoring transpeptidase ErfK/SrfK